MKIYKSTTIKVIAVVSAIFSTANIQARKINPTHIMPFAKEITDTRSSALGGITATLDNNPNAIYGNPAAASLSLNKLQMSYSFNRVKNTIIDSKYQNTIGGYLRLTDRHAILFGSRYYLTPHIQAVYANENHSQPYDFSFDMGYSMKIIDNLSVATTISYLYTKAAPQIDMKALVLSLSGMYLHPFTFLNAPAQWRVGVKAANFGFLFNHREGNLPASGTIGTSFVHTPFRNHTFNAMIDGTCYFVRGGHIIKEAAMGIEYTAYNILSIRGGYHLADESNGGYSYISCGTGLAYKNMGVGFSYLFASENTPVENSWWISTKIMF